MARKGPDAQFASLAPRNVLRNFAQDQKDIWTSPFRLRIQDLNWLVPAAGVTAGLIASDSEFSSRVRTTGFVARHSNTFSNAGVAAALGGSGGLFLLGKWRRDGHHAEAGILSLEAASNSLLVAEGFKLSTARERPADGTGLGRFWTKTGYSSSFPSDHAAAAWSVASVLAHEYPGPLTQLLAYGMATGVSLTRITGRNHFPSDVVVGSALGWLIGRQVYARHHDSDLGGDSTGTFPRLMERTRSPQSAASAYVPLDSWIYPAFSRLSAMGIVHSGFLGLRPWTRRECARLLQEAEDSLGATSPNEGSRLFATLKREFAPELGTQAEYYAGVDSLYTRVATISGPPLTDGYHFAQTIVNDFGRPYERGANFVDGFSASASAGMIGFYVRGEYEHAPSAPGFSQAVINSIAIADQKPSGQLASPIAAFNQFRLLDSYVMLNFEGWQASFGKQSLWLGPTSDPFLWSTNAEPIYMFRVDQTTPRRLPSILGWLGPYRVEFWVGKLTGHHFVNTQLGPNGQPADLGVIAVSLGRTLPRQPMVNGQKINFKPTPNFEFGVGKTGLWGGPEFPITIGSTLRSLLSFGNAVGRGRDPGDRRSTFDFSYRLPRMRWVTLYEDSFVEDEISPIGYPRRAAHTPGLYFSRIPGAPKMDLRVEGSYTNLPGLLEPPLGGFFYWNVRYLDGYTNQGNIIGNATVGRRGIAYRAAATYWFAADKTIQAGYRRLEVERPFLQGGRVNDVDLQSEWSFNQGISLSSTLQYERWNFPLLSAGNKQDNLLASVQVTYWPHWRWSGSH